MEGELQVAFGLRLRQIRRERGLSQERMAEEMNVHRTYVGGLERGERNVTVKTLERWSDLLGEDPVDMLIRGRDLMRRAAESGEDPGAERGETGPRPAPEDDED